MDTKNSNTPGGAPKKPEPVAAAPMGCSEAELLLDEYVDAELSEFQTRRFERHLEHCSECRELEADCRLIVETARKLADRPVPPQVSQRLRNHLKAELGLHLSPRRPQLSLVE